MMTREEIKIRDDINKELEALGFHLKLNSLHIRTDESIHDYVQPIHDWFDELPQVDAIVTKRIKDWQRKMYRFNTRS